MPPLDSLLVRERRLKQNINRYERNTDFYKLQLKNYDKIVSGTCINPNQVGYVIDEIPDSLNSIVINEKGDKFLTIREFTLLV